MSDPTEQKPTYEPPDHERPATGAPTVHQLEYEMVERHDPYAALRHKGFLLYSFAWMMHVIGHQMQSVALGWEVYDRTGDELALGLIGAAQALPLILLSLPAGAVADRFDRRRIILITSVLASACSLGLAMFSYSDWPVYMMYLMIGLENTMLVFGRPARSALLPQIVPQGVFANAVTWNSSLFQICTMVGPALAGVVLIYNVRAAYLVTSVTTLLFGLSISLIKLRYAPPAAQPTTQSRFEELTAGVRFVLRSKIMLAVMTLDLFAVLLGGATYLMPVFAKNMKVGSVGLGWLRAGEAIGAFVMALVLAHLPPMRRAGRALLLAVAGFGLATVGFGLSKWFLLSMAMVILIGAFDMISVVIRHTLVQTLTPDRMRGRVSAVNQIFIGASNELGGLESGLMAAAFGPVFAVVSGGIGTIGVVLGVMFTWPQIRRLGALTDVKPEEELAIAK